MRIPRKVLGGPARAGLVGIAFLAVGACGWTPRDDFRARREVFIPRDRAASPVFADADPR